MSKTHGNAPLVCPHCGTLVPKKTALSCSHCGADEHTAWGYLGNSPMGSLPTGWSEEDEFSYDEFLEKEFGVARAFSWRIWFKKAGVVIILLGIIHYFIF